MTYENKSPFPYRNNPTKDKRQSCPLHKASGKNRKFNKKIKVRRVFSYG